MLTLRVQNSPFMLAAMAACNPEVLSEEERISTFR